MTDRDRHIPKAEDCCQDGLGTLLARTHEQLGTAVTDRITARGGPPELRPPDLALDRLLAAAHRSIGIAVTHRRSRENRAALTQRNQALEARLAERGPLFSRPSPVRLKYRQQALCFARRYWPVDLAEGMRAAVRVTQHLSGFLENTAQPAVHAEPVVQQLRASLDAMARLPKPQRSPATLTGLDYLVAVESALAEPAQRLLHDLHRIRQLLDEELAPAITTLGMSSPAYLCGVDAVAQDLIDDLTQGCGQADALAEAVAEVERASSDFVGADLSSVKLDGVLLEGILWDATTVWPEGWETLIRSASMPAGEEQGVLIVAAEPSDTVIHAEA
ncbi:hypothetical protein SAMN05216489_00019 [Streptomyces sp. 3213]|uniref:hypothetical protein n=1 Tax=Streptomyces sp. 3213.3 TaxID=1855348 RepID=UPI00089CAFF6|nr:hypothetical protein [Streptomyces sp. 3213.3]SEC15273.1 hypothetical protein SAMN05216489_00019 [Streptomyces sp. 3213] [Streptomyces sp. 3213.3]